RRPRASLDGEPRQFIVLRWCGVGPSPCEALFGSRPPLPHEQLPRLWLTQFAGSVHSSKPAEVLVVQEFRIASREVPPTLVVQSGARLEIGSVEEVERGNAFAVGR